MYLEYCLIANVAICTISLILFCVLKKKSQTSIKNTFILVFCTVLTMICASLVPLFANYLVKGLSFSIPVSFIVTLLVLVIFALAAYYLFLPICIKRFEKNMENTEGNSPDSLIEKITEDYSDIRTTMDETAKQDSDTVKIDEEVLVIEDEARSDKELLTTVKSEAGKQHIPEDPDYDKPVFVEIPMYDPDKQFDILMLLEIAIENKASHNFQDAIAAYESALILNPDDELRYLIILDLCSLYKMTGNTESIYKLLGSARCNLLDMDKKADILRNIKIS